MHMETRHRCWSCGHDNDGRSQECAWCGVWLIQFRPDAVPSAVRSLLPAARRWGISDDGYRDSAVAEADAETLAALVSGVDAVDDAVLYGWLAGPEAGSKQPSAEYAAVTALTMAADQARLRLRQPE
jgi:predicted  nucleic acid-binding Zn-ribbon protein